MRSWPTNKIFAINDAEIKIEELLFQIEAIVPSAYAELEKAARAAIECRLGNVSEYSDVKSVQVLDRLFRIEQSTHLREAEAQAAVVEGAVRTIAHQQAAALTRPWTQKIQSGLKWWRPRPETRAAQTAGAKAAAPEA